MSSLRIGRKGSGRSEGDNSNLRREGRPRRTGVLSGPGPESRMRLRLEVEPQFHRKGSWRHVVRSTEGGKKVIERHLVGQVDGREAQAPLTFVAAEKVVVAHREVEQAARLDSLRIVVVILRPWRRYLDELRPEL